MNKSTWLVILERIDFNGESMTQTIRIPSSYIHSIPDKIEEAYPSDNNWTTIIHAVINQNYIVDIENIKKPRKKTISNGKADRATKNTE